MGGAAPDPLTIRAIAAAGTGLTNYPDVGAGAKAAVTAINAAGGVNGKPVEYSFWGDRRRPLRPADQGPRRGQRDGPPRPAGSPGALQGLAGPRVAGSAGRFGLLVRRLRGTGDRSCGRHLGDQSLRLARRRRPFHRGPGRLGRRAGRHRPAPLGRAQRLARGARRRGPGRGHPGGRHCRVDDDGPARHVRAPGGRSRDLGPGPGSARRPTGHSPASRPRPSRSSPSRVGAWCPRVWRRSRTPWRRCAESGRRRASGPAPSRC